MSLPSPLSDPAIGKALTLPHTKRMHIQLSEWPFIRIQLQRLLSVCRHHALPSSKGHRSNQSESLSRITSPISAVGPVATDPRPKPKAWQPCHSLTMLDAAEIGECTCGAPHFLFFLSGQGWLDTPRRALDSLTGLCYI